MTYILLKLFFSDEVGDCDSEVELERNEAPVRANQKRSLSGISQCRNIRRRK